MYFEAYEKCSSEGVLQNSKRGGRKYVQYVFQPPQSTPGTFQIVVSKVTILTKLHRLQFAHSHVLPLTNGRLQSFHKAAAHF